MGYIFGVNSDDECRMKLNGISSFKEHFINHGKEDYKQNTELHLVEPKEINLAKSRMPQSIAKEKWNEVILQGSPFLIAVLLGEYTIAEDILAFYPTVNMHDLGEVNWTSYAPYWESDEEEITVESLIYSGSCTIPERLRNFLLSRIVVEANDCSDFTLRKVKDLGNPKVQKLLVDDTKNYPRLFSGNSMYAHNIEALYFLLQVFQDSIRRNFLLLANYTGWGEKLNLGKQNDLSSDLKCVGKIVNLLHKSTQTYDNLYLFLLKLLSLIQMKMMEEDVDINCRKQCKEYQNSIWKMIDLLPFDEERIEGLSHDNESMFLKELLYELAERKLGKKMPLYINPRNADNPLLFFGLEYLEEYDTYSNEYLWYSFNHTSTNQLGKRLIQILPFVSRIEYLKNENFEEDLKDALKEILSSSAEELKDTFPELLAKGFIPDEYLDFIMNYANRVKKCAYMCPLLIMHKYGGIK